MVPGVDLQRVIVIFPDPIYLHFVNTIILISRPHEDNGKLILKENVSFKF